MGGIVGQADQYGLPHREARDLPAATEISDLLAGHQIMSGLMARPGADEEE